MFKHLSRGNLFRAGNVLQAMAWIMAMSRPIAVRAEEKNLPAPASQATSAPASLPLYQPTATDRESLARAEELIRQSELQSAIETLSPLIESHPTWIGALILRGHAYLRKDEMNEARESFQDAVNLDGRDRDARLGVAVACLKLKETADALESLDQLLSVHPEDGMAVVLRADALLQDGQRTEGLQYIQAILTGVKGPIKVEFLAKLIPLQLRAQDYANAESAASEWIATKPAGDAYAYRAEARRATKKLDDALADVVAGFKESAGQLGYPLLLNASQVWIDRGDAVTAICTLVDLLERVPGAYRARGGIRLQLEEYGYAISDFKSAILKGDTSVDVLMYLAECQPFMDVNAAKETYQKIIAMPPQGFRYMSVSDAVIAQARLYLVEHLTPPRP